MECFGFNKRMSLIWTSQIPEVFHSSQKQIFKKNPWGSTLDGNVFQILKTQKRDSGSQTTFHKQKSFKFPLIQREFYLMKQRFFNPRWNSTFFRIDTTYKWISNFGKQSFSVSKLLSNLIIMHSLLYNTWLCFLKHWAESSHEFSKSIF